MVRKLTFIFICLLAENSAFSATLTYGTHQTFLMDGATCDEAVDQILGTTFRSLPGSKKVRSLLELTCKPEGSAQAAAEIKVILEPYAGHEDFFREYLAALEGQRIGDRLLHFSPVESLVDTIRIDMLRNGELVDRLENSVEMGALGVFLRAALNESNIWSRGSVRACLTDIFMRFDLDTSRRVEREVFPNSDQVALSHVLSYRLQGDAEAVVLPYRPVWIRNCVENCSLDLR